MNSLEQISSTEKLNLFTFITNKIGKKSAIIIMLMLSATIITASIYKGIKTIQDRAISTIKPDLERVERELAYKEGILKETKDQLSQKEKDLEKIIAESEDKIRKSEEQIKVFQETLSKQESLYNELKDKELSDISKKLNDSTWKLSSKDKEIKKLEQDLKRSRRCLPYANKKLDEAHSLVDPLQSQIQSKDKEIKQLNAHIEELNSTIKYEYVSNEEHSKLQLRNIELVQKTKDLNHVFKKQEEKIRFLQSEIERMNKES